MAAKHRPQCRYINLRDGGGYVNCAKNARHKGGHRTHAGYGLGWTWVEGPPIPPPQTVVARLIWRSPNSKPTTP